MKKFALFLAEGFEETEAIGVVDLLRRAGIKVDIISMDRSLNVKSSHNVVVVCDFMFNNVDDLNKYDGLLLPGGLPGVSNLNDNNQLNALLNKYNKDKKLICAICAAPSILANMGLLNDKQATVYPGFETTDRNICFTGQGVEVADNIITSKGLGFVFDFALTIIEKTFDKNKAYQVANSILYDYK